MARAPRRLVVLLYGAATGIYALDRITKLWAESSLARRPPIRLLGGIVQLNYTTNAGGAFGLFGNAPWLFAAVSLLVCAVVVAASRSVRGRVLAWGLGLILGGALGNLTDRIARGDTPFAGRVVDFIDLHVWPIFNGADAAIVIGTVLVLLSTARRSRQL